MVASRNAGQRFGLAGLLAFCLQPLKRSLPKAGWTGLTDLLFPFSGQFLHIARWQQRIEVPPFYDKTCPPHWQD